ncbi:MAG: hypothetical protein FWF98_01850, partial [Dehalococcoidia bacterium]|nr:hypothetical protein [Dehalococcoidia bacterium]
MVKFSYVDNSNTYRGELLYIANEGTLFFAPFSPQANYSVMIAGAYLSLDVDLRSGEAKHISGYNSKHLWRNMALQKPHATRGKLFVLFDSQAIVGAGEYYSTGWATYFDKINNTICIG